MPNTQLGQTIHVASTVRNIDQWKKYLKIGAGDYVQVSADEVDYTLAEGNGWVFNPVTETRDYSFNAPFEVASPLVVGDMFTVQWRPAGYDADIDDVETYYVTSDEYSVTSVGASQVQQMCAGVYVGL
jgi:hypothetical protein